MDRVQAFGDWFKCHKAAIGAFFLSLATVVGGTGTIYNSDQLVHAAAVLALIGGSLSGAGMAKSDQFYRDREDVLKTQIGRRSSESYIPPRDLMKLEAKADKPSKENE